ncbi:DNA repair exonuclease [Macrolepiota fuliginosa MF-IS2]|uniref:Double-strand break repair protein n=1 Tax=Macrolepiota fuliginosa MF-IS2 TaxID=1400762 RepID=A0A9P6C9P0_9AGAR|nr:DNA repair exonuclease [Macrolepiota fuliginosa MF-IS2]
MSDDGSPQPTPIIQHASPDDTISILLATDNHIGYNERDPIRGQDSINTFEEILQLAVKHDVDFILLAGDLFHENKPSRECLYRVMALLREYTMGDKPVQVELLSDPNEGKADSFSFPAVNYEDPNFNVGIPVFSIHGNHDDPQGTGADGALCALDVLSVSGLLNYMGKIDLPLSDTNAHNTGIAVRPVLLRKGNTYLGMYGIGNVKDQRMHFELRSNRVRMYMPKNKDDWFNVLLLHQNRVKHGPQEFVPEGMFDDSIDLVVWGHEHDCRIRPEPVAGKNYYITQPGSSVATSLADGEALEKHVALLEIQDKKFQITPIPLRTIRPFVIEEISLLSAAEEESFDITDNVEIAKFLKSRVNALIEKAHTQFEERNAHAKSHDEPELKPMLPLIRIKVDATGVTETFNPIRFGQEFQGRIANPRDVLTFHRSKKSTAGTRGAKVAIDQPELSIDDPDLSLQEKLAKVRVQTLVKEYLGAQELQLLGETGMSDAIQMFVEKDDTHAIETHVQKSLAALIKTVARQEDMDEDDLEELLAKAKEQHEQQYIEHAKAKKAKGKAKAQAEEQPESDDSMLMDVDVHNGGGSDFDEESDAAPPPPKKRGAAASRAKTAATTTKAGVGRGRKAVGTTTAKAPAKKPAGRGRGKKVVESNDDDGEVIEVDDVEDDEDDYEEEVVPKTKKTSRAAVLSQPAAKKTPAKKRAAASSSTQRQSQLNFQPAARSSRAAATKARGKMVVSVSSLV